MRTYTASQLSRTAITFTAASLFSLLSMQAQTPNRNVVSSASNTATTEAVEPVSMAVTTSAPTTTVPTWHETVVPEDKQISAKVTNGILTIDGLVAKVQLNYDIHHAGYLYIFVPGVGTAVVSRIQTYGSTKVSNAFHGNTLAFNTGGHDFELTSQTPLAEGRNGKEDAYVRLDNTTLGLDRMPMIGYGSTTRAPYAWPLSGTAAKDTEAHFVQPPPMPRNLLPRTMNAPAATIAQEK